jgi:hypothetical protein
MSYWFYKLLVVFAMAIILSRMERKRRNRARLLLRLSASWVAFVCIALLSFPAKKELREKKTETVFILTEGFNTDSVTHFLNLNKATFFFSADYSLIQTLPRQNIKWIPDLAEFFTRHSDDSICVFGNGFSNEELNSLKGRAFVYKPAPVKPAVSAIYWQKELMGGAPLVVQGTYDNNSSKDITIRLQAFGDIWDSITIKAETQKEFSLYATPKQAGKAVYSVLVLSGKDTLQNDPVPVIVERKPRLNILMISSSPDFEKTFLKNHLARHGYQITMSTTISKSKKDEQFVNTPKANASLVNPSYLDQFDVVIADDKSVTQLSPVAGFTLRSAIEVKGLGLIVKLPDSNSVSAFYSQKLSSFPIKPGIPTFRWIHSSLNDSDPFRLTMSEPICIRYQQGVQPLLQDEDANIYAANFIYGQGRIVGTTLNNTYTLALSGNNKAWQSIWTLLLDKASKKTSPDETWYTSEAFSYINQPSPITIETDGNPKQQVLIDSNVVSLQRDSRIPYQWQGIYWPRQSGWQMLIQPDGKAKNWFVYGPQQWKSVRDYNKAKTTKQYAVDHRASFLPRTERETHKLSSDMKLYLVILFLICCGFLWVEQKMA